MLEPREATGAAPLDEQVARALAHPVGAPSLRELAQGAGRVLFIVDDATRHTPVRRILPHVARELKAAGVRDEDVTLLTAQGTHRRMTDEELDRKVGPAFRARWRVLQHDYRDRASLHDYGETASGLRVVAHRLLAECDVRVGIGQVGVHGQLGYSGGAKIVVPGIAGAQSETGTHWAAAGYPQEELLGVLENPLRHAVEEAARIVRLDAVLNVSMDAAGKVFHAAYGDPVGAQRDCARPTRALAAAELDAPVGVVVVESAPADLEYWQSIKGLYAGTVCVEEGGVIVLATPSPEGVAARHPNVLELAALAPDEIRDRVEGGRVDDVIGAAVAHYTARMRERSDIILVSGGIPPQDARRLGFTPAATMQDAVDEALARTGGQSRVAFLRAGGALLPMVGGRNRALLAKDAAPRAARGRGAAEPGGR